MRENCRHFESRSYPNGDTVRKCDLDLAPEAPWRCPDECPAYTPRRLDAGWQHGSLGVRSFASEPESVGQDSSIGALLDAAEDIVNAAVPEVVAELEAEKQRSRRRRKGAGRAKNKSAKPKRRKRKKR